MRTQYTPSAPPIYPMDETASRQTLNREHATRALQQMYNQYGMSPTQMALNPPQGVNLQEMDRLTTMRDNPQQYDAQYGTGGLGLPKQGLMNVGMPGTGGASGVSSGATQMSPLQAMFGATAQNPTMFGTSQVGRLPGLMNNNPF